MTVYPLRQLDGRLLKTFTVTTTEIETNDDDPSETNKLKGMWVFRDEAGDKFMWRPKPERYEFRPVDTVAEADQVSFLCPLCFEKNGGPKGTHSVMVTFEGRNVPDEAVSRDHTGKQSRWAVSGSSLDDLVLTPSILLDASREPTHGCHWHGFVGSSGIPPGYAG